MIMDIYVHKVRMNPIDRWGRDIGIITEILGTYSTLEKAQEAKSNRDVNSAAIYCDIGKSWIEKVEVQ